MFILKNEIQFDMAHYLSGYNGKCANIHGHRYRLIVKVASKTVHKEGQLRGMVDDFGNIKEALKEIEDFFDHKLILEDNDEGKKVGESLSLMPNGFKIVYLPYRTTAEEMSRHIFNMLKEKGINVYEVELFETPTNSCIYREE
ncbi:6-pyruvoyl trahydropterin synthase family protein [Clostridium sp.]|uniref:6-pyruvoyl trahydropterin synthase family protein n=1 Tax=Clostridium sp. TaxID=1506 RepID=UPI003F320110